MALIRLNMQNIFILISGLLSLANCFTVFSDQNANDRINSEVKCDQQLLQKCSLEYSENMGIPQEANATRFMERISKKRLDEGREFFLLEIASLNAISYCLGDQFEECISKKHMIEEGLAAYDAAVYAAYIAMTANAATKTFSPIMQHFGCFFSVYNTTNYQDKIVPQCTNDFNAAVKKDPDNLCPLGHTFLKCLIAPMDRCGDDLVKAFCDNGLAGFSVNAPRCDGKIKCDF